MTRYFVVRRVHGPAWDPSLPMRKQAGWPEHAAFMDALVADGLVVLGGPLGEGDEVLLVMEASREEIIRTRLAADPWSGAGVLAVSRIEPWTILLQRFRAPRNS
ncbi:MAG: YciI family protein [Gemmatimonadota bacterium]|nr:YciI family protein [Gemmatimonadota bacterium]